MSAALFGRPSATRQALHYWSAVYIGEFFDRRNVEKFSAATCRVETSGQYLGRLHHEILAKMR